LLLFDELLVFPFLLFEFILPLDIFEFDEPLLDEPEFDIFELLEPLLEPLLDILEFDIFDEFIEPLLVVLVVFEFLPLVTFVFESPPQAISPKDAASKADIANPFFICLIPLIISKYFYCADKLQPSVFPTFKQKKTLTTKSQL
jgi:hypothetical protein